MDEDLSVFFDDFARDVVLVDQSQTVRAIVDGPLEMQALGGIEATLYKKSLLVISDTVAGIEQRSPITVDGITYRVAKILPDGTGLTFIGLTIEGGSQAWVPE